MSNNSHEKELRAELDAARYSLGMHDIRLEQSREEIDRLRRANAELVERLEKVQEEHYQVLRKLVRSES